MVQPLKIFLWRCLAVFALTLGVIGAFLPVMPTVPFVLLAAWAASRGWPRLEAWLLDHPLFGKSIREWRARGAVSRRAKYCAGIAMFGSAVIVQFTPLPDGWLWMRWALPLLLACIFIWLWRRPEH